MMIDPCTEYIVYKERENELTAYIERNWAALERRGKESTGPTMQSACTSGSTRSTRRSRAGSTPALRSAAGCGCTRLQSRSRKYDASRNRSQQEICERSGNAKAALMGQPTPPHSRLMAAGPVESLTTSSGSITNSCSSSLNSVLMRQSQMVFPISSRGMWTDVSGGWQN